MFARVAVVTCPCPAPPAMPIVSPNTPGSRITSPPLPCVPAAYNAPVSVNVFAATEIELLEPVEVTVTPLFTMILPVVLEPLESCIPPTALIFLVMVRLVAAADESEILTAALEMIVVLIVIAAELFRTSPLNVEPPDEKFRARLLLIWAAPVVLTVIVPVDVLMMLDAPTPPEPAPKNIEEVPVISPALAMLPLVPYWFINTSVPFAAALIVIIAEFVPSVLRSSAPREVIAVPVVRLPSVVTFRALKLEPPEDTVTPPATGTLVFSIAAEPVVLSVSRFVEDEATMPPEPVDRFTPPAPEHISVPPVCVTTPVPVA